MTGILIGDAAAVQNYLFENYSAYDDFKNGMWEQYQSLTTDAQLRAYLKQSLDNNAPFQEFYEKPSSSDAPTDLAYTLIDAGLDGSKTYLQQLSKQT